MKIVISVARDGTSCHGNSCTDREYNRPMGICQLAFKETNSREPFCSAKFFFWKLRGMGSRREISDDSGSSGKGPPIPTPNMDNPTTGHNNSRDRGSNSIAAKDKSVCLKGLGTDTPFLREA